MSSFLKTWGINQEIDTPGGLLREATKEEVPREVCYSVMSCACMLQKLQQPFAVVFSYDAYDYSLYLCMRFALTALATAQVYLLQRKGGKLGAGLGKTTGAYCISTYMYIFCLNPDA